MNIRLCLLPLLLTVAAPAFSQPSQPSLSPWWRKESGKLRWRVHHRWRKQDKRGPNGTGPAKAVLPSSHAFDPELFRKRVTFFPPCLCCSAKVDDKNLFR